MKKMLMILLASCVSGMAFGKLPPPNEEAKAKADQAKAKSAWGDKVAAYKLCMVQDQVAASYRKAKPSNAMTAAASPACQDPGPFVVPATATAPAAAQPEKK